ncbi:MAG: hypothetical protein PHU06_14640 [Gallionella sp.]|nr:hypothetical protein [Gallionella sp.]
MSRTNNSTTPAMALTKDNIVDEPTQDNQWHKTIPERQLHSVR